MPDIQVASQSTSFRSGIHALLSEDSGFVFLPMLHPQLDPKNYLGINHVWICMSDDLNWLNENYANALAKARGLLSIGGDFDAINRLRRLTSVWGYLPVHSSSEALRAAIYGIDQGLVVFPPELLIDMSWLHNDPRTTKMNSEMINEALSERELEVLRFLAKGLQNKEIALALQISENTIKYHVASIYSKLDVLNRTEAVVKGARLGLLAL